MPENESSMKGQLLIGCLLYTGIAWAQHSGEEGFSPSLRGSVMMAYSHIPQANQGGQKMAIIPTWGFDVDYIFHRKWSISAQADIKMQSFEVESEEVVLDRSYPFSLALAGHFRPLPHWSFFAGPGLEFEQSRNLWIFKIGTEYAFEISETFEIGIGLIYENREEVYDGFTFGVSFNTRLWTRHPEPASGL
jgi:hypothetical protein